MIQMAGSGLSQDTIGQKIRKRRNRLGFTLEDLAAKAGISKPYLSLIETGRVANPPSDLKLRGLEKALEFPAGELLTQAHLQRTPVDVRAMLHQYIKAGADMDATIVRLRANGTDGKSEKDPDVRKYPRAATASLNHAKDASPVDRHRRDVLPKNLDAAYLSGLLHRLADQRSSNVERITTNVVPVINKVSAGYPSEFTDLSYPAKVADDYIACPDLQDPDAFAARVFGDSMAPKYREGDIVIFSPAAAPSNGNDCFCRFDDGQTTFKRVFFDADEAETKIRLQPRNERYPARIMDASQITGIWKAVYKYQRVDED